MACLALVAEGLTSKEIARRLGLSPSTVDSHVRSAIERLGAADRSSAATLFLRQPIPGGAPSDAVTHEGARNENFPILPPLGGVPNRLSVRRRMFHIIQIALMGIAGMAAAVSTIAGAVRLFSE